MGFFFWNAHIDYFQSVQIKKNLPGIFFSFFEKECLYKEQINISFINDGDMCDYLLF